MGEKQFDVVVIGAGPGGYVCAIRCAQLGLKTACVEGRGRLGGTCLNVGCIPSKSLLHSSEKYHEATSELADHGVLVGDVKLDLGAMMKRKDGAVDGLTKGVEFLFKKNKVEWLKGWGTIPAAGQVKVALEGGGEEIVSAKHIIIAAGSEVTPLPGVEIDGKVVVSSDHAIALPKVPDHMVLIGGGVIGLEMGSVWSRLGAKVTVVEYLDRILPTMDAELSKEFAKLLKKQGVEVKTQTKVVGVEVKKDKAVVKTAPAAGGDEASMNADVVLVAIGRRPNTAALGLDAVGVAVDQRGFVTVDDHFKTSVDGIYAIGDCIHGPMLAHKAEEDGVAIAEILAGQAGHVNYDHVPGIVYTHPEVASVGKTEEQLKDAGVAYKVGKFPFMANSRARANGMPEGFVKILSDKTTDKILGAHILGPAAGDLIMEVVAVMEFGGSAEDVARTCHGHPTFSEAVKEAALAVDGRAIHF